MISLFINSILIVLAIVFSDAASAAINYTKKANSIVESSDVQINKKIYFRGAGALTLADIVKNSELDSRLVEKLSRVTIKKSLKVGEEVTLSNAELAVLLRKSRYRSVSSIKFNIPNRISIIKPKLGLDVGEVEQELISEWSVGCKTCKFKIIDLSVQKDINKLNVSSWVIFTEKLELPRGAFSIPLKIKLSDNTSKVIWVRGKAKTLHAVPVLNKAIGVGHLIKKSDIVIENRNLSHVYKTPATLSEILGKVSKRSLKRNQIVWNSYLERQKAFKRGDLVNVFIGDDSWRISTKAVALEIGYIGDTARLKIIKNKKILSGTVLKSGEVQVQ